MENSKAAYLSKIEEALKQVLPTAHPHFSGLFEAMRYSLDAGGKRIRPMLMQLAYEAVGGTADIAPYLCAMEMVHTYSLIHDDLPCMDDDDLRRGKPTNHVVYGEATAVLAGDALLTHAFTLMLEDAMQDGCPPEKVRAAFLLSEASGPVGMIGGQILDMASEGASIDLASLDNIHLHKTGALIAAALEMGAVLGHGSEMEIAALRTYGKYLGKVFQIIDDVLDVTSTEEALGKPIASDEKNLKNTYLSFYTPEACYEIAQELTAKAIRCLEQVHGDTALLEDIARSLVYRKN